MRTLLLPLLFFIFHPVQAAPRSVECRFLKLGSDQGLTSVVVTPEEGDDITCDLPFNSVSEKILCPALEDVIHFLTAPGGDPVASATLPAGLESALLVFYQTPAGPEEDKAVPLPWKIMVIDDSTAFKPGDGGLVGNCFDSELRYTIGEKQESVPALESRRFAMPEEKNDFNMAQVIFERKVGADWKLASQSSLRFIPGLRYLLFVHPNVRSGQPRITVIKDIQE